MPKTFHSSAIVSSHQSQSTPIQPSPQKLTQKPFKTATQAHWQVAEEAVCLDVGLIRRHAQLSQSAFALLLGVSVRTLQEWEQGRRNPCGAAYTLLKVAAQYPDVLQHLK